MRFYALCRALASAGGVATLTVPTLCDQLPQRHRTRRSVDRYAEVNRIPGPAPRPGEPTYTRAEVAVHDDPKGPGLWVTYRDGVYDVTGFLEEHPGGEFLLQAAGGSVDRLWAYWHWHHASPQVPKYLEQLRIGRLSDYEGDEVEGVDLFEHDPVRPSAQRPLVDRPWSSQTAFSTMNQSYLTPANSVYCRSHCPIPDLDSTEYQISFCRGHVEAEPFKEQTIQQLEQAHGRASVTAVLQCGGNRAAENLLHNGSSGFTGTNFARIDGGMMGNVLWGGVRLSEVLEALYPEELAAAKEGRDLYVEFHGADGYYASVPLMVAMQKQNDCLLATSMNGSALPRDHGHPVRATLPGIVGARNVKWLERVVVREGEGSSPWNNYYYKNKSIPVEQSTGKFQSAQRMPLNCVILHTGPSDALLQQHQALQVSGVVFSGSGAPVRSVEVSTDQGNTWQPAELNRAEVLPDDSSQHWHWVRWRVDAVVDLQSTNQEVWARAALEGPVEDPDGLYQIRESSPKRGGYLFNGYHKVPFVDNMYQEMGKNQSHSRGFSNNSSLDGHFESG